MDLDHLFQHAGFISALKLLFIGSLLSPGVMGRSDLYHVFAAQAASHVVTFGPPAMLSYILYALSKLN